MSGKESKKAFWNERAWRGQYAGTNDLMIKQLEQMELAKHFPAKGRFLEIGCGNGETALHFASSRQQMVIDAIDFSEDMISAANMALSEQESELSSRVTFSVADIRDYQTEHRYDVIYSQRSLINLDDWAEQERAIRKIQTWLVPGGQFLMCENSIDGLFRVNEYRSAVGLPAIDPPWHNCYMRESDVAALDDAHCPLEAVHSFSSTYYFLSRVVNAALAAERNEEPRYDSPINQLALKLPAINECGQTKLWIWRRSRSRE